MFTGKTHTGILEPSRSNGHKRLSMTREELIAAIVEEVSSRSRKVLRTKLGMSNSPVHGLYDMDRFITYKIPSSKPEHQKVLKNVLTSTLKTRDARYRRYRATHKIPGV
jgi:hypothetical protein